MKLLQVKLAMNLTSFQQMNPVKRSFVNLPVGITLKKGVKLL